MTATDLVMLFDEESGRAAKLAASLDAANLKTDRCHEVRDAIATLRREKPSLAVVVGGEAAFDGLSAAARDLGIPTLALVEPGEDPRALADQVRNFDGWASLSAPAVEVSGRVASLLDSRRRSTAPGASKPRWPADPKFLGLIVHDLRTPLNVIGLTIRALHMSVPKPTPEFAEDLTFLTDNARQIEKMLALLGDYSRMIEAGSSDLGFEFDPRRFLADFLEERKEKERSGTGQVMLEIAEGCPREVRLDQTRVRLALQYALTNAVAAAGDSQVRVKASGRPGRWTVEIFVDRPPPDSVTSVDLQLESFERLLGIAAERRGLDLAITAALTRSLGGTARLVIEPTRWSSVILDWPERSSPG